MYKPLNDLPTNLFVQHCKHSLSKDLEEYVHNMQEAVNIYAERALQTSVEWWSRKKKAIVLRNKLWSGKSEFYELKDEKGMDVWKRCIKASTHFLVDEEIDVEWYAHGTFGTIKSTQFLDMSYSDFTDYLKEKVNGND